MNDKVEGIGIEGVIAIIFGEAAHAWGCGWPWRLLTPLGIILVACSLVPNMGEKLNNLFEGAGLFKRIGDKKVLPKVLEKTKFDGGIEYALALPPGLSSEDFCNHEKALGESLGGEVQARYAGKGVVRLRLITTELRDKYPFEVPALKGLTIPIGFTREGLQALTFGDSIVNLLVGGITGSGKTCFLRQALTSLALTCSPAEVGLTLIDPLKGEFALFRDLPHVCSYADSREKAVKELDQLVRGMEWRYAEFAKAGAVNIDEYNRRQKVKMGRVLTVIDEYAEFRDDKHAQAQIDKLLRLGRAAGMHHIICTQRPSRETLQGIAKSNIAATLAFNCRNAVNSQILLDNDKAAGLYTPGRAIYQTDRDREVQVMWLSPERAKELLSPLYVKRAPEPEPEPELQGVFSLADYKGSAHPRVSARSRSRRQRSNR
jgi:hypothetical protein